MFCLIVLFILSGFLFGRNENLINQADRVRVRVKKKTV